VAIDHRAFFGREGEIVEAPIVSEPWMAVEFFDLGVFENRDAVLVSSGHGGSLFLLGHGTHLLLHRADAALYALADIALVTPLIDGMNLVAKKRLPLQKSNYDECDSLWLFVELNKGLKCRPLYIPARGNSSANCKSHR
jgi:hypothetical protein